VKTGMTQELGMDGSGSEKSAGDGRPKRSIVSNTILALKLLLALFIMITCAVMFLILINYVQENIRIFHEPIPVANMTDKQVVLTNNRSAIDPTYDQLIAFLKSDNTSSMKYSAPDWTCADFAKQLHDNAEAHGIRAAFVAVEFTNDSINYSIYDDGSGNFQPPTSDADYGHGIDLFNTTDKGPIYVDASSIYGIYVGDRIAYVSKGREFNEIDLSQATGTDYSFYTDYKQRYINYIHDLKDYNQQAQSYNAQVAMIANGTVSEDWRTLNQTSTQLKTTKENLDLEKISLGDFYYPVGITREADVYW